MASVFAPQEIMRYRKQLILEGFGAEKQLALKQAKVLVIGVGGLGCPALLYLNAAGVGHIGIADHDTVDISNLHRQVLYGHENVGERKVDVAVRKLSQLNPFSKLTPYPVNIDEYNIGNIIKAYDLVIDGCDNFQSRYVINDHCVSQDRPVVYGSILGNEGQVALFNYRRSCHLRDIFPEPPDEGDMPDCSLNGVLGTVTGIIGTIMAQEAVNVLTGEPTLANKLLLFNAGTFERTMITYSK